MPSLGDLLNFSAAHLKNKPSCCGESGVDTHYINFHVFLPLQMASKELNYIKTQPVSSPWLLPCSFPYIISKIPGNTCLFFFFFNTCLLKAILVAAIIFCLVSCLPSVKWMNQYCWFYPFSSDSSLHANGCSPLSQPEGLASALLLTATWSFPKQNLILSLPCSKIVSSSQFSFYETFSKH